MLASKAVEKENSSVTPSTLNISLLVNLSNEEEMVMVKHKTKRKTRTKQKKRRRRKEKKKKKKKKKKLKQNNSNTRSVHAVRNFKQFLPIIKFKVYFTAVNVLSLS